MDRATNQPFPLRYFILIRLLFGHYHEISSSRIVCFILRTYCLFFSSMTIADLANRMKYDNIYTTILMTDLLTAFALTYMTKQAYLIEYIQNIEKINAVMRIQKTKFLSGVGLLFFLISLLLKIITTVTSAIHGFQVFHLQCGVFVNYCVSLFIISSFHETIKKLRQLYEEKHILSKFFSRDNPSKNVRDLFRYLSVYDSLIENVKNIDVKVQLIVTNIIIFRWLEIYCLLMVHIYNFAILGVNTFAWIYCMMLDNIIQASSPAILMELVANEVTRIRNIIARQMERTEDPAMSSVLRRSLRYLHTRPPRLALWRAVAVDARLLPAMLALLLTYSVVAMQFMGVSRTYMSNYTEGINTTGYFNRYH